MKLFVLFVVTQLALEVQAQQPLANFLTPNAYYCVPVSNVSYSTFNMVFVNASNHGSPQICSVTILPFSPTGSTASVIQVQACGGYTSNIPLYSNSNSNNSKASACSENDSFNSNVVTANATRTAYQNLLYQNLNLNLSIVSMMMTTVLSSVDQNGNQFSAQLVFASDALYSTIFTIALNCNQLVLNGAEMMALNAGVFYGLAGNNQSTSLNNFTCSTTGCCVPNFWYFNMSSSTIGTSCPCPLPGNFTVAPTTVATTAIKSMFNATTTKSAACIVYRNEQEFFVFLIAIIAFSCFRMK